MAAFGESKTAPTKWAQRTDTLYVTLSIPDVKGEDLKVTEKGITFKGTSNGAYLLLPAGKFPCRMVFCLSGHCIGPPVCVSW